MSLYYVDTSAALKLLAEESHSRSFAAFYDDPLDADALNVLGGDCLNILTIRLEVIIRQSEEMLVDDQVGQVAGLDPRGGVEVDAGTLDRGRQDRPGGGVDGALGLLAQQRRERRQERRELGVARRATGSPPATWRRGASSLSA